ncbi:hypothetical protein H7J75_17795 [Mycolicibacterium canariasense]|nr:hypothetical protein [Mycolicibacterium canariasense]ORU96146.1 hypothetical protein AWB94_31255 [Mycolicibacterium canariasense]
MKAKADELLTEVTDTIKKEIREHLPAIIEAVVKAVAETSAHLATDGVDKLTDVIPGDLDDKVIDPIVTNVLGSILNRFGL